MKKSQLKEIIKEEIKSVIKELEVKMSNFLKSGFPNVISYHKDRRGSNINWKLISNKKMTKDKIAKFQSDAGNSPMGYGGPFELKEIPLNNNFEYTWTCWSSSG